MAERLGNWATNQIQKVAGSIPGHGQGISPSLPQGNVPVLTVSRSG